ncbi:MAG: phosphotransferase [Actinomycetota bacterium]
MRPTTIADTAEALTPEWLTQALASSGHLEGATIPSVETQPLGTGQMCDSVRIAVTYDRPTAAPTSLVAKLPATDPTSRNTAMMLRNYVKEVSFYRHLVDGLEIRTPQVYYADIDDSGVVFILLMQDMAPAEQGDQLAGCTPEVARAALREMVGLHAPRWNDATLKQFDWLYSDPEQGRSMSLSMLPMLWNGFVDRYDDQLSDEVRTAGRTLFENIGAYVADLGGPKTIVHGDYRLDNLLLGPGTDDVAVVDWQTIAYGPAASDAAYFIGAGLLPDVRREHEDELLRAYYDGLLAAGVTGFTWDECRRDYRRATFAGLVMAVGASMLVERTERGDRMFMVMAERHAQHALDLDALAMLGSGGR